MALNFGGGDELNTFINATWGGKKDVDEAIRDFERLHKASSRGGGGGLLTLKKQDSGAEAIKDVGKAAQQAEGGLKGLLDKAGGLQAGWKGMVAAAAPVVAAIGGITLAAKELNQAAEEGANLAQLESSFKLFTTNAGVSAGVLNEMVAATNNTMDRFSAMEGMLTLVAGMTQETASEFAKFAPELAEISKAATKLNPTLGDTNFMFQSLARGIKRSEVRLLDNLGLNVKAARANEDYARSLGKTVEALTAEERTLALLYETVRVGGNLVEQVGGDTEAMGDAWVRARSKMAEYFAELKIGIAETTGFDSAMNVVAGLFDNAATNQRLQRGLRELRRRGETDAYASEIGSIVDLMAPGGRGDDLIVAEQILNRVIAKSDEARAASRQAAKESKEDWIRFLSAVSAANAAVKTRLFVGEGADQLLTQNYGSEVISGAAVANQRHAKDALLDAVSASEQAAIKITEANQEIRKSQEEAFGAGRKQVLDLKAALDELNEEAYARYRENLAASGDHMRKWIGDESLYTTSIDNIGQAWVATGGRTKEQQETLEDLQDAYDRAAGTVRDYQTGIKGFGQDQDKINEKIGETTAAMAHYEAQIAELNAITPTYSSTNIRAQFDQEKLNDALLDAAEAAGTSSWQFAGLMVEMGKWEGAQASAAIGLGIMSNAIEEMGESLATGTDPAVAIANIERLATKLENTDFTVLFTPDFQLVEDAFTDSGLEDMLGGRAWMPREERQFARQMEAEATEGKRTLMEEFFGPIAEEPLETTLTILTDDAENEITGLFNHWNGQVIRWSVNIDSPNLPDSVRLPGGASRPQATGGRVYAGEILQVGEQGVEHFIPRTDGHIIGNHKLGKGGGDTYNINNYGGEAVATQAALLGINQRSRNNALLGR